MSAGVGWFRALVCCWPNAVLILTLLPTIITTTIIAVITYYYYYYCVCTFRFYVPLVHFGVRVSVVAVKHLRRFYEEREILNQLIGQYVV